MLSQLSESNKLNNKITKNTKKAKERSIRNNIRNNRKRKKTKNSTGKTDKTIHKKFIDGRVEALFGKIKVVEIGRQTKFLIRNTAITPFIFLYALSMGLFGTAEISLDMLAVNINDIFGTSLTGAAFCLRSKEKKSVLYLKSCFQAMLSLQLESAFKNDFSDVFCMFKGVFLEDSTMIELNENASKYFSGSGGSGSTSSLKLNWVFNICFYAAVTVNLFEGNIHDAKNAKKSLKYIKKGSLIIRDLGYFSIEALMMIGTKGAYYLSRLRKGVCLYLNENDREALDVTSFLEKITRKGKSAKVSVYIGAKERLSVQLIAQKVPKWAHNQRIKKYKDKDGKKPSAEYIALAKYSIFITNIPDHVWSDDSVLEDSTINSIIMEVYRIRWQIELLFKKFKSKIKLNIIKGKSKNRILCLVYGRLISLMLGLMVFSFAISQKHVGREVSLWKVATWLVMKDRLAKALLIGSFEGLYGALFNDFKLLCKDRRKRKTPQEKLEEVLGCKRLVA